MSPEWLSRLRPLYEQLEKHLMRIENAQSWGEAIQDVRERASQDEPHLAPLLHHRAQKIYSGTEGNTVNPSQFDAILGLIQQDGQMWNALQEMPDEAGPMMEEFLRFVQRDLLPSTKESYAAMAKRLPRRPAGGRPKVTREADQADICKALWELERNKVARMVAQRRVAARSGKKLREIQRIWKECKAEKNRSVPAKIE